MKSSFSSVLPIVRPPKIRRKYLRKYSWLPDVLRIKGSIVTRISGPVLTVTLFSTLVSYAWSKGYKVILTNSVIPLLSVVVGLILVFSTSYDRYWEGRKSFAAVTSNIRNLSRQLWVNVGMPPVAADQQPSLVKGKMPDSDITLAHLRRRKVEALKLCLSFAFATKHYLRGEDGLNYADYNGVLPANFARFDETGYNTQKSTATGSYAATNNSLSRDASISGRTTPDINRPDATKRIRVKRSKQQLPEPNTPLLSGTRRSVEFHPFSDDASLPLPLIIAHELTRLLFQFRREGFLETVGPAGTNAMGQLIQSMVDQLGAMERVANTPIPISYGIHLKQCVTLYLFALPMTLVNDLGWATIPIVTVVAFTFMGIEGIADDIEMPFGTDGCDLPLDRYCADLKEEIDYIIERLPEGGEQLHGYDDGEGDD
ncbi:Bestrophin, RFP-TM, chloride channel-domain-containing protein [Crucibulum laeve]|uniref:Bestrophin, RFP-TM, chloride channel-domain-containing protein n=1 Tax=Crucibulum laeve TaxID=68775 RepID=A0A5C3MC29_9AGAR|nr:Bestrophin, RFP-TM, chloride channel-domain-containing protein [Crucibulum laeve]